MSSFSELPILPSLAKSLAEQGIKKPTEIQAKTIVPQLERKNVVGVAQTGSGKTLAYVLPMLHTLKCLEEEGSAVSQPSQPRGVVLVPARELGTQVGKVFKSLTHGTRLRVRMALGASAKKTARQSVAGKFEVLVATPGRLSQLVASGDVSLVDVRSVVIDEADRMLDASFIPVVQKILRSCPTGAQLVLFSATLPKSMDQAVASLFSKPPLVVRTRGSQRVVPTLSVEYRPIVEANRYDAVRQIIESNPERGTLLFVNTVRQCDALAEWLDEQDLDHVMYRGQMDRVERSTNLRSFREGDVSVLLTTDLGGRGLDIDRIACVVNVHMPADVDTYLHRAGRTARAGRPGLVVNLVGQRDHPLVAKLRKRD